MWKRVGMICMGSRGCCYVTHLFLRGTNISLRKVQPTKERVESHHLGPRDNGCCVRERAISKIVDGIVLLFHHSHQGFLSDCQGIKMVTENLNEFSRKLVSGKEVTVGPQWKHWDWHRKMQRTSPGLRPWSWGCWPTSPDHQISPLLSSMLNTENRKASPQSHGKEKSTCHMGAGRAAFLSTGELSCKWGIWHFWRVPGIPPVTKEEDELGKQWDPGKQVIILRVFKTAWLLETNSILIKSMVPTTAHRKYSFSKYRKDHDYSKVNSRTHTHTSNWLTDWPLSFFFFSFCKVWNFFHKNFHTRLKVIKAKLWWHPGTDCRAPKWNVLPRDIELEVKLESNLQTRNGMHWLLAAVGHLSLLWEFP